MMFINGNSLDLPRRRYKNSYSYSYGKMATVVDDDDAWLYGESNEEKKIELDRITERLNEDTNGDPSTEFNNEDVLTKELPRLDEYSNSNKGYEATDQRNTYSYNCKTLDGEEDKEAGELSGEEENKEVIHTEDQGSEDSDSDDDDAVQVTIGDIKPPSYNYGGTPVNLNIKRGGAFGSGGATGPSAKSKGIDMDSLGSINGVPVYEFNLDTLEDKPWRKPGADLTDYFNYGFNEDSWKIYCERQRKLRLDNNVVSKTQPVSGKDQQIPVATVNENSKYSGLGGLTKKAGPPPGRKMSGSIDVIGGGAPSLPSRRPATSPRENVIQVIGRKGSFEPPPGMPPLHLPPPHIPPPFLLPPPDHNISIPPPPGPIPPPGLPPPSIPPPPPGRVVPNQDGTFQDSFDSFQQTPFIPPHSFSGSDHSSRFDEMSSFYNGNQVSHNQFDITSESTQQSWNNSPRDTERSRERERDRDRERDDRDRDREHERGRGRGRGRGSYTQWEYARDRSSGHSGTGDEEHERRRYRGEYHERPRERERDREHSHDRDRERDERYERDRERRHREHHRERDDRYRERSSRRRHQHDDEDSDRRSSRHKHKRSKREKEEGSAATAEAQESETANSSAGGGGGTNSAAEDGEEKSS